MARGLGAKRKRDPLAPLTGPVLNVDTADEGYRQRIVAQFQGASPYKHCVLKDVVSDARLRRVRDEIIHNIKATLKETDIYKVLQTGDLANLDGLHPETLKELHHLKELRDTLYSKEFRAFVESVTGCGELIDKTDCSCNVYPQGGHLLCHDDVIGTRRVSYILYLSEPGEPWKEEYGGALELYDCVSSGSHKKLSIPEHKPCRKIMPQWNHMTMFAVLPGKSFHSIEEVVAEDKPRLSISGWFHGKEPPPGHENASLSQIIDRKGCARNGGGGDASTSGFYLQEDAFAALPKPMRHTYDSTEGRIAFPNVDTLVAFVNPQYLAIDNVRQIASKFVEESHVQLYNFLRKEYAESLLAALRAADEADGMACARIPDHERGVGVGWGVRGPTHKQRFLQYDPMTLSKAGVAQGAKESDGHLERAGEKLLALQKCIASQPFQQLLASFAKVVLTSSRSSIRRFRPGLDYSMAHGGVQTDTCQLDATLCFVHEREDDSGKQFKLAEVGAYDCYMVNDENDSGPNNQSAEVYRETNDDEDDETVTLPASNNCLNLVLCNENVMRFTKYVSAQAAGSRWDILTEYHIDEEEEEEEEEE